jgi:hypothetical protein
VENQILYYSTKKEGATIEDKIIFLEVLSTWKMIVMAVVVIRN